MTARRWSAQSRPPNDQEPRDLAASLRDVRELKLAEIPAPQVAQVVRHIVGVEQLEVAAFNSSI